jgi:hypothetical protein
VKIFHADPPVRLVDHQAVGTGRGKGLGYDRRRDQAQVSAEQVMRSFMLITVGFLSAIKTSAASSGSGSWYGFGSEDMLKFRVDQPGACSYFVLKSTSVKCHR